LVVGAGRAVADAALSVDDVKHEALLELQPDPDVEQLLAGAGVDLNAVAALADRLRNSRLSRVTQRSQRSSYLPRNQQQSAVLQKVGRSPYSWSMAPEEPTEIRERMWVVRPAGTHLSEAAGGSGGQRGMARADGTNKLETHATLFPLDDDEDGADLPADSQPVFIYVTQDAPVSKQDDELRELLGALVLIGALKAVEKVAPHAKRWWDERALPVVRSTWNKPRTRRALRRVTAGELATSVESAASVDASQELGAALEAYKASMSSVEAQQRLIAALMARLFSDGQLRMLREARIEDETGSLELGPAMATLTPEQLGDSITLMLEANPSLLDGETLVEIGKILGVGRANDECISLKIDEV